LLFANLDGIPASSGNPVMRQPALLDRLRLDVKSGRLGAYSASYGGDTGRRR
jgi:hypothetical protein